MSLKRHRACYIWEARTHLHVDLPLFFATSALIFFPLQPLPFPRLLPPLTFQEKYCKYSLKQVFFAHFRYLRSPVVMALSRGIFLKNGTWIFLGIVSFSTEISSFRNKTEQNKISKIIFPL